MQKSAYIATGVVLLLKYQNIFKALSDEIRLRLLRLLAVTEVSVCVCELVDTINVPQYQVSRQLSILKKAGLVDNEKKGRWAYYYALKDQSEFHRALFNIVKNHVNEPTFMKDEKKLKSRLAIRDGDTCVVGHCGGKHGPAP
ncbi:MAG: transcriptional regulator [Desulfobacteraceae bacterium]|jgi:ArsR family transcriptional regulator|nr:MAG: transcriptional regulator [Desulfobacteraceae bacterium]